MWCPYLRRDIERLERVQRRATKRVSSVRSYQYSERLTRLQLDSLERRRLAADLVQVFKMTRHLSPCDFHHFFTLNKSKTRGHSFKIKSQYYAHDFRKNFFSIRTIDAWNSLPAHVFQCKNVKAFKSAIFSYFCFNVS